MNTQYTGLAKAILLIILITMLVVTGCTRKHNLTGNNWSDARPLVAADTSFTLGYSYTQTAKVTGSETKLLCGRENGIEALALMQFIEMPDTMTVVGQPVLTLKAVRKSPVSTNPLILSFYRINKDWAADSTDTVEDADLIPLAIVNYPVPDTITTTNDSLGVPVPIAVIENWKVGNETGFAGFNIAIKVVNPGWLEIKSNEYYDGPLLSFTYNTPGETTNIEYSEHPTKDSHRITGDQNATTDNAWFMKNIKPQRMYFKFNLPDNIFIQEDGTHLTQTEIKQMTINKAELVLYTKSNTYYNNVSCGFYPYIINRDTLTTPVALTDDDLAIITGTYSTSTIVNTDSVRIDITAIVQGFTSGDKNNSGVVVKSLQEMANYGNIDFWHYTNAPAGKKPYVKISYTPPYLKSH